MEDIKYLGETPIHLSMTQEEWAVKYIEDYFFIDGAHHKQWLLDQVARILMGTKINCKIAKWDDGSSELRYSTGEPSKDYINWIGEYFEDEEAVGIAP